MPFKNQMPGLCSCCRKVRVGKDNTKMIWWYAKLGALRSSPQEMTLCIDCSKLVKEFVESEK